MFEGPRNTPNPDVVEKLSQLPGGTALIKLATVALQEGWGDVVAAIEAVEKSAPAQRLLSGFISDQNDESHVG